MTTKQGSELTPAPGAAQPGDGGTPPAEGTLEQRLSAEQAKVEQLTKDNASLQQNHTAMQRNLSRLRQGGGNSAEIARLTKMITLVGLQLGTGEELSEAAKAELAKADSDASMATLTEQFRARAAQSIESAMTDFPTENWEAAPQFEKARVAWDAGNFGQASELTRDALIKLALTRSTQAMEAEKATAVKPADPAPAPGATPSATPAAVPPDKAGSQGPNAAISDMTPTQIQDKMNSPGGREWYRENAQAVREKIYS